MLYFQDRVLQRYIEAQGLGGNMISSAPDAIGEYLAVVNANIGGAKSDAFINQKIDFTASINELGEISNNLVVSRTHQGAKQTEWWYRANNRNYMQVYTPLGSHLIGSTGRGLWPKLPLRNYSGYGNDADLEVIAKTQKYLDQYGIDRMIINQRTVFAAWVNTNAGKTSRYSLSYNNPYRINPSSNTPYEFIFEKQSGVSTSISISISAPPKYKWKEINKGVIEYRSDDPPARIRIRQTLIPIE